MSDTASPDGGVVYLRGHRPTEPEVASVDDAFDQWWASFRMTWLASVELVEPMHREALRGAGETALLREYSAVMTAITISLRGAGLDTFDGDLSGLGKRSQRKLFGPSLPRELPIGQSVTIWKKGADQFLDAVMDRLEGLIGWPHLPRTRRTLEGSFARRKNAEHLKVYPKFPI